MVTGILGRKIGMTQVFGDDGLVMPATVIKAGPCVVVQRKTVARDGYEAVQLGLVEDGPAKVNKPTAGHYKKAKVPPTRIRREFPLAEAGDAPAEGDQVTATLFADGDRVDVTGVSRGKGFQGVMKRHGFSGGGASHGSMFHRAPGSIGASSYPSRVIKGMRGPGRMGGERRQVSGQYGRGREWPLGQTRSGDRFGTLICFESAFASHVLRVPALGRRYLSEHHQ